MSNPHSSNAGDGDSIKISKLVATGNDFVFLDARENLPGAFGSMPRAELTRRLCDRHFGIGADGAVFVEKGSSQERLKWDFYNSDGSSAEMCGNATRCMGRWAQLNLSQGEVVFETIAGVVTAKIEGEVVRSELSFVAASLSELRFELNGSGRVAYLVNTGVPHAVVDIDRLENADPAGAEVRALRFHPDAGPRGANVTFLQTLGPTEFKTVTFERGVEGWTLSCGTGVLAAAAVGLDRTRNSIANVTTPGGSLIVHYGTDRKGVSLTGPATQVFTTILSREFLK